MRIFPSLDSWGQNELETLKTATLWAGAIAAALAVLIGFWWNEFRERINARMETLSQQQGTTQSSPSIGEGEQRGILAQGGAALHVYEAGKPAQASFVLTNVGRTAVTVEAAYCDAFLTADVNRIQTVVDRYKKLLMDRNRASVVGPGQKWRFHSMSRNKPPIEQTEIDAVTSGKTRLYLAGAVRYFDGVDADRTVGFCFVYEVNAKAFFVIDRFSYLDEWLDGKTGPRPHDPKDDTAE